MKQSANSINIFKWVALCSSLCLILSLKFSPAQLLAVLSIFSGITFFLLIAWENLSNGILLWLASMVLFSQANVIKFANLPNFPVERLIWALLLLIFLLQIYTKQIRLLPFTLLDGVMLLFITICLISIASQGAIYGKDKGFREFLNGFAVPFVTYFISKNVFDDDNKVKRLLCLLFCTYVYLIINLALEKCGLGHMLPHFYFVESDIHIGRFMGPFENAAACGTVLVMLFHSTFYLQSKIGGMQGTFLAICGFIGPVVLFFTYTRSAWLSFLISLFVVLLLNRNLRAYLLVIFTCLLVVISINLPNLLSEDRTRGGLMASRPIESRLNLYHAYYERIKAKPFLGHGFGEITHKDISLADEDISSHDTFMSVLVELGIPGFSLYTLIYILLLRISYRQYKFYDYWDSSQKDYIILYWAILISYLLNCFTIEMRYFIFINGLVFILSGTICGKYQRQRA